MNFYRSCNKFKSLLIVALILIITSCTGKGVSEKTSPVESTVTQEAPELDSQSQVELFQILIDEAQKFIDQGNYQDALFVYNQALSQVQDQEQESQLFTLIEDLLAITPSEDIEYCLNIEDFKIPHSMLLYWLGLNLALEGDNLTARIYLNSFLDQYPDHQYYNDATDLLEVITKTTFHRETIGVLLPLSGKYAIFGERALAGIQLAVKEYAEKHQKQFKIIIEDSKADPEKAIEALRRLYLKNVSCIIGPWLTAVEAGQEVEKLQTPMIALTQKTEFPLNGEYLFSNFITPRMQVKTLGTYLFEELEIEKVAILYPDEKYGRTYMNLFWDIVDQYGGEVVGVESYDRKGTDFTKAIQKLTGQYYPVPDFIELKTSKPGLFVLNLADNPDESESRDKKEDEIEIDFQAIFIPDSPSNVKMILPQLAYNDVKDVYLVGNNLWHHKRLLKETKGYNENTIIADGFFGGTQNPLSLEFAEQFKTLFNRKPQFIEAIAYDTASIVFSTAMDESINSQKDFRDALLEGRIFEGSTGITRFDSDGAAQRQLFLMTIKDNKFVEINR